MVTKGRNLVLDLRASLGITQMLPRNTGMNGDIIGTGVKDLAPLRGPIKASTMVAVARDMAGTGADFSSIEPASVPGFGYLQRDVWTHDQNIKSKLIRI